MNDEIKEMIEQMESIAITGKDKNGIKVDGYGLGQNELKMFLDYITNLQQENFNLRENILIHKMSFKSDDKSLEHLINMPSYEELQQENETRQQDINNLTYQLAKMKEENERLKETNVYCNRTDCIGRIKNSRKYDSVYQEKEDYKSRCEKAIEYINKNKHLSMFADCREPEEDWNYDLECSANDLLNILQNGSEENE